jgi:hypothetical protein
MRSDAKPKHAQAAIKNDGNSDLLVSVAGVSCGCTKVLSIDERIKSKQQGNILFEVSPAESHPGLNTQTVAIKTNASDNIEIITLQWRIKDQKPIELSAQEFEVKVTKSELEHASGAAVQKLIILDHSLDVPLQIINIGCSSHVKASAFDATSFCSSCNSEIRAFRCEITLLPSLDLGKSIEESVELTTNSSVLPKITIPIHGVILPNVRVEPAAVIINVKNQSLNAAFVASSGGPIKLKAPPRIRTSSQLNVLSVSEFDTRIKVVLSAKPRVPASATNGQNGADEQKSEELVTMEWANGDVVDVPVTIFW